MTNDASPDPSNGSDETSSNGADAPRGRRLPFGKALAGVSLLIATVGGGLTLLFQVYHPSWEPCVGSSEAAFTGAPVFPETAREYNSTPLNKTYADPGTLGVDIRATYRSDNLPKANLYLYYSLVTVGSHGTVNGIVKGLDERSFDSQKQSGCSDAGGFEFFVYPDRQGLPALQRDRPYRVVLELYRGKRQQYGTNRLAVLETPVFYEPRPGR
jgi:hypothetical protein